LEFPNEDCEPLIESLIISDYLDEKYPQHPLHNKDPLQKARDKILIERFNSFITPYYRILLKTDKSAAVIKEMTTSLDIFEEELKKRATKFFGGSKPGMLVSKLILYLIYY
jgi:glutathione S-transferase